MRLVEFPHCIPRAQTGTRRGSRSTHATEGGVPSKTLTLPSQAVHRHLLISLPRTREFRWSLIGDCRNENGVAGRKTEMGGMYVSRRWPCLEAQLGGRLT